MATIKKKDLKSFKFKEDKQEIDELVDADGTPIEGDRNAVNNSEIETAPQATTDDFARNTSQPNRYYFGLGGTPYSHGSIRTESENIAEEKMKKIIEDLIGSNRQDTGMVTRYKDTDVNRNEIPDLDELSITYKKPVVAKKAQEVLRTMEMNNLNGEEIGIVLNYILNNVDLKNIPADYKNILKNII